jgi:hypothetical protein
MKINQAEAILGYLEFQLLNFVEETEKQVADPDIIGDMYDRAYGILADMENTLDTQILLDYPKPLTSNKKSR